MGVTGYRPFDGKTYDFISRNWIPLIFVASPFSPTSPPFGPLFHAFFPPQVGWVLRVPRYGRVCVCVWNIWTNVKLLIFIVSKRRGHSISLGLCPTKLPGKWDIQLGQLDVPAIRLFHFRWHGTGLSREPLYLGSIILFHCTLWDSVPDGSLHWSSSFLVCACVHAAPRWGTSES